MRFGIYTEMQCPDHKPYDQLFGEVKEQTVQADQLGYDMYSTIDHHFFPNFGISANPLAFFSAVAQCTKRIRFRTALHTLPFEHPLRLAGQIAVADILTGGRLECGMGRGHPWCFGPHSVPLEESRPRFDEALEIILKAWTEERVSHEGRFWSFEDVRVVPKPVQKPHPPICTGGVSDVTYRTAGERGWGILLPPLLPNEAFAEHLDVYVEACERSGYEPNVIYLRPIYVSTERRRIRSEAEQAICNFMKFNVSPLFQEPRLPPKEELEQKGYGAYASERIRRLGSLTYDEIVAQGIAFVGTPDEIITKIEETRKLVRIDELSILTNYGGMDHARALRLQELFAERVVPAFGESSRSSDPSAAADAAFEDDEAVVREREVAR